MSKKISIDFSINADTSGAKQTKQAIEEVQKTAEKGMTVDASGFDALIAKMKELRASMADIPSLADAGQAESGLEFRELQEFDKEAQTLVNRLRELGDTAIESMQKAANVGDAEGLKRYSAELERIKAAYDYLESGKPFKAADDNATKALKEYEASIDRISAKTQELVEAEAKRTTPRPFDPKKLKEEQDYWAKKLEETEKQIAEEKSLDESKKASAQTAKRTADVVIAAQKRQGMSLEELRAEYERYSQALRDANTQGDKDGMKDNVAHLRVLKTEIKAAEVALNRVPSSFDKTGKAAVKAGYMLQSMQGGIRGVIHNIPSLTMALGGGMGLAGALTLATTAGSYLFEKINEKSKRAAEEQKKRSEELAQKADDLKKKFNDSLSTKEIGDAYDKALESTTKITDQYKFQTEELKSQLQLRIRAMEVEEGIYDYNSEADKHDVSARFHRKEITKEQRDIEIEEIDMKSAEWKRNQRERKQVEIVNSKRREEQNEKDKAIAAQKEADEYESNKILTPVKYDELESAIKEYEERVKELIELNKKLEENTHGIRSEQASKFYKSINKNNKTIEEFNDKIFSYKKSLGESDEELGLRKFNIAGSDNKRKASESYYKALEEKKKAAQEAKIGASNATISRTDAEYQYEDTMELNKAEKYKDAAKKRESDAKREADAINNSAKLLLEAAANFKEGLSEAAKKAKDSLDDARKSIMNGLGELSSDDEREQSIISKSKEIAEKAMKDNKLDAVNGSEVVNAINSLKDKPETAINKAIISQLTRVIKEFGIESLKANKADNGVDEISKLIDELASSKDEATREMIIGRLMEAAKNQSAINNDLKRRLSKLETAEAHDKERRLSDGFSAPQRQEQPASSVAEDKIEQAAAALPTINSSGTKNLTPMLSKIIEIATSLAQAQRQGAETVSAISPKIDSLERYIDREVRPIIYQLKRIANR